MSIVIGGMIGLGKTSVADTLSAHFKNKGIESKVFYEAVDDNPILPLYYELTQKNWMPKESLSSYSYFS